MGEEIEKKFLVKGEKWKEESTVNYYKQAYISIDKDRIVRVRIYEDKGFLAIKGNTTGCTRKEFEYEIPLNNALEIFDTIALKPAIEKKRYTLRYKNKVWEIDEFMGENKGLIVAEVELQSEDEEFFIPDWLGKEVTMDNRYSNASLVNFPYKKWGKLI